MARSKPLEDLRASILEGSQESFDLFCQPCSSEQHLEAVGYCQECCEYLCTACIRYHAKLAASKHHTVLDKSAMPKAKIPHTTMSTDVITEKCRKHPDKVLEYFCKTHNQICCSVCVTLDHNSCSGKSYIPYISGGKANSQEHHALKAEIDRLVGEITKREKQIQDSGNNNGEFYDKALTDIRDFRKQINDLLDKIEEETKKKVTKFHQENVRIIGTASDKCQSLLSEVNSMASNMDTLATAGKNNQLFVRVKLFFTRIANIDKEMNENGEYKLTRYAFDQIEKTQQIMSTLSDIWSLSLGQDATPTNARYVREVKVKADDDIEECIISAVTIVTDDRMIVTDQKNVNVKLIDMKESKVVSCLALPSQPFDMTSINPNQVAVTLGNAKIGIITVTKTLQLSKTVDTHDARINGLCYDGSNFIACSKSAAIKVIGRSGKTLNIMSTTDNGEQLFTEVLRIALNRDKDVVYASDYKANTVTSLALSGHVIFVYRHEKLKCPVGVTVGKNGEVYVCSRDNHTIHQLTATGELKQIILGLDNGLAYGPFAIAYNDDWLYISSYSKTPASKNYIRLFKLE